MNRIYFILIFFLVLSACKKDEDQNSNPIEGNLLSNMYIYWDSFQYMVESDTIDVPIQYHQSAYVLVTDNFGLPVLIDDYDKFSFNWNINNETAYSSRTINHTFQTNGIKEISISVTYQGEEMNFTFYIKVYGFIINSVENESYGFFIDESDNSTRTVFTREDDDMLGYEFNKYELVSRKVLDQETITSYEVIDFSKDKNGNLNLWTWHYFYKYDKHANKLLEKSTYSSEYAGNIYISTENEYFLVGTTPYRSKFYHFDQNGGNYGSAELHESIENLISKDGLMLNDSAYILLINNTDNNETSLVQKKLNSNSENTLVVFSDNYHRIIKTNEGYITYELGDGKTVAYLNQNLQLVWDMEIGPGMDGGFGPMRLREFQNSFLIINRNQLISISKSGELNFIKDFYNEWSFTFKSISESSNKALVLADIRMRESGKNASIMFVVDENGNVIE